MFNQRMEWCRAALTALLTVTSTVAVIAQPPTRISNSSSDFGDFNQLIRNGSSPLPVFPGGNPSTTTNVDLSKVDPRVVDNLLKECVVESERLYRALSVDYQRYPEVRSLLQDLISLRARTSRLSQDMASGYSLERLLPDLKQLDSDWHLMSHRFSSTPQLSRTTQESVSRIDGLDRQLEKLFKMEPQLDRRALMLELARLSSSIRNLAQELELDPEGGAAGYSLAREAQKLDQQADRVQQMVVDQYPYTSIVNEYIRFGTMWTAIEPQLRAVNSRYVERSLRNVMLADDAVHNLLWIEQQTSRENLKQIAASLMKDVDEFYNRVPLKLLLHFKDANGILQTSNDFYGTVQHLIDCVNRNENDRTLIECYGYVEEYGAVFIRDFEQLRSSTGKVVLREIEDGILALRNELNLAGTVNTIDTPAMRPAAAALANLADQLDFDVQQWLARDRQATYRSQALQASISFVKRAQRLQSMLQVRPTAAEVKAEINTLVEDWKNVYQYLGRCNTEHRDHLRILAQEISQKIFELRAPLQL
ncbi:MAG: hypothetical protein R3C49_26605 [Planctomycetaceae bacterium]